MPIGIVIAVAVVLIVVAAVISHFLTVSNLKNNAESKIGNAEARAREIIDDAVKTAEAKKKESLLEIKEESIKNKNELEKETKERRSELQRYEKRVLSKEEALDKKSEAIERREAGFTAKEAIVSTMGVLANVSGDTEDAVTVAQGVASWFPSTIAAFTFLLFNLLDSPCLAAIATMAQQMQSRKWFWFAILFQNVFAYLVTTLCIPDRYIGNWRRIWSWYSSGICGSSSHAVPVIQT